MWTLSWLIHPGVRAPPPLQFLHQLRNTWDVCFLFFFFYFQIYNKSENRVRVKVVASFSFDKDIVMIYNYKDKYLFKKIWRKAYWQWPKRCIFHAAISVSCFTLVLIIRATTTKRKKEPSKTLWRSASSAITAVPAVGGRCSGVRKTRNVLGAWVG